MSTKLPLALIEEIDQARGSVSHSDYLRMVISAAMTHSHPHLPGPEAGENVIERTRPPPLPPARSKRRTRARLRTARRLNLPHSGALGPNPGPPPRGNVVATPSAPSAAQRTSMVHACTMLC